MNIHEIEKELGLRKVNLPNSKVKYEGVLCTGMFEGICHYNRGIVTVRVYEQSDLKYPLLAMSTIDDDSWIAYGSKVNLDVDTLVSEFNDIYGGFVLPSAKELNKFLNMHGAHGCNQG